MERACKRGADQKYSAGTDDTLLYIYIYIYIYTYMYMCMYVFVISLTSVMKSRERTTAGIIFGAMPDNPPALNLKDFLFSPREDLLREVLSLHHYGILSTSTVLFNFGKYIGLRGGLTRLRIARVRELTNFSRHPENWNCYPSRDIYRIQGYNLHFFVDVYIRGDILGLKENL